MSQPDEIAIRVRIHGRVQGVGYRAWTASHAQKRGLKGWVRNRIDGTVEALFKGDETMVREMIQHCWDGPLVSKVTAIDEAPAKGIVDAGFERKPTV